MIESLALAFLTSSTSITLTLKRLGVRQPFTKLFVSLSFSAMTARPEPNTTATVPAGTMADEAPVQRPPLATTTAPAHHIHYTAEAPTATSASAPSPLALTMDTQHATSHGRPMSDSDVPHRGYEPRLYDVESPMSPIMPPGLRRRSSRRAVTFRNVDNFSQYEVRPGWQPGAEPGIDTSKPDGGRETLSQMISPSEITVVDFSQNDIATVRLDNATLGGFLATPQPAGTKCRWINVNGLSWDVIQMLGNYKRLHRLAIEDLINTRNRTKADWYPTHTFMVLTLQKLVHFDYAKNRISQPDDDSSDSSDGEQKEKSGASIRSGRSGHSAKGGISKMMRGMFRRRKQDKANNVTNGSSFPRVSPGYMEGGARPQSRSTSMRELSDFAHINAFRTLQRYHSSPNDARTDFMESHSALSSRNLAVAAEQVSLFITNDNTVISFFELSAQDVEQPILTRLRLPDTSLRRSCDASMVAQAIIDAIIDLAIPVTVCYGDVIADLELDVLTSPSINHTKSLYMTITEMNKVLSFINPVMNLINTLRDHKTDSDVADDLQNPEKGVIISP